MKYALKSTFTHETTS